MRIIFGLILSCLLLGATPAQAQFGEGGGFGGIFEDILKQGKIPQPDTPQNSASIDNIPVHIAVDQKANMNGKMLVVSAYAPPNPSGKFETPVLLGQTHLLLTGLRSPLTVVVAAPRQVTETLDFARIEAKILDENGNTFLTSANDGFYKGQNPADLTMVPLGYKPPSESSPRIEGLETINGKISIAGKTEMFRGSNLTVQLVENGLAGGLSTIIAAETLIDIDQKNPPINFTMERGIPAGKDNVSLALNAWITDWAGRKTHVMETPVPYNGPDRTYQLTLDKYSMQPPPQFQDQTSSSNVVVSGEAQFDAYKGLPSGCRLTATLSRAVGAPGSSRALDTRTILLDGLAGNVRFDLVADSINFDPLIPAPTLSVRITDENGRLFFSSADIASQPGMNIVQLTPSAAY